MYEYKTVVTDYEGMQEALSTYGGQGWRLRSMTPDTWRFMVSGTLGLEMPLDPDAPEHTVTRELSASYYLLVFERKIGSGRGRALEEAEETIGYILPEM